MGTVERRRRSGASALTLLCATALLAVAGMSGVAQAAPLPEPGAKSLEQVRKEIDELYRQAGTATDAYNLAEGEAKAQSAKIVEIAKQVVAGQDRITALKNRAGAAARAQYRSGGMPAGAQLALSSSPSQFLDGADRIRRGEKAATDLMSEMNRTQSDLQQYAKDASAQWEKLEANRIKQETSKKQIEQKIKAAEALESKLQAEEKARLIQLEQEAQYKAQSAWLSTGVLKEINSSASESGKKAIQYATAQMGKPYVWGAEGPDSFDCSGLTSQAWRAAGKGIPRTSQEQLRLLPKVAIKDMRPGDLIIYFDDASHVGMYVGDGAIVHAPRPGRNVTLTGAGSMPIKAVVRPDA
ncbi:MULTISPECIES: C40 family peptidase [unclassified Streptomyces]|uniref:C40 family peptidase n=1 Tax=unclassified Streptomyces TaxID=2593676 RepID=UPI0022525AF1|nr:C40 family peptidase [Streptomyces sp. NBC_01443]MCX4629122.1 NlpC/P60 family protein [Streptomyces sp. NBC_01443]WSW45159.1 NlpC/P60 family protein [Streptomyces sp. NBC_01001]